MSIAPMQYVFNNKTTKGSNRLMLLAIADRCDDEGECYPGVERLGKKCNVGRRQAINLIQDLERLNEIRVIEKEGIRTNGGSTNRYHMVGFMKANNLITSDDQYRDITPKKSRKSTPVQPVTPSATKHPTPVQPVTHAPVQHASHDSKSIPSSIPRTTLHDKHAVDDSKDEKTIIVSMMDTFEPQDLKLAIDTVWTAHNKTGCTPTIEESKAMFTTSEYTEVIGCAHQNYHARIKVLKHQDFIDKARRDGHELSARTLEKLRDNPAKMPTVQEADAILYATNGTGSKLEDYAPKSERDQLANEMVEKVKLAKALDIIDTSVEMDVRAETDKRLEQEKARQATIKANNAMVGADNLHEAVEHRIEDEKAAQAKATKDLKILKANAMFDEIAEALGHTKDSLASNAVGRVVGQTRKAFLDEGFVSGDAKQYIDRLRDYYTKQKWTITDEIYKTDKNLALWAKAKASNSQIEDVNGLNPVAIAQSKSNVAKKIEAMAAMTNTPPPDTDMVEGIS